jgi:Domain of unknown function (DUF4174)
MSRRALIVSGAPDDPRVAEQLEAVRADAAGVEDRELDVSSREAPGFTVELLGKDGAVRARWSEVVGREELWARIDAMPMRRRERRESDAEQ